MDKSITLKYTEKLLIEQRGFIVKIPKNKEVIFVASGGLDSSIGMARIIEEYGCKVYPLFIRRYSKAMRHEEKAFDKICAFYKKRYGSKFANPKKVEVEIPPLVLKKGLTQKRLDTTGHALRNSAIQTIAVQYGVHMNDTKGTNIKTIFAGSVGDDSFPHNFIEAYRLQTLMTCWDLKDWEWQILSPYVDPYLKEIDKYKKENIEWAIKNKIPLKYTITCTLGRDLSCGKCGDCKTRLKAFKEAGYKDPIKYEK